MLAKRKKQEVGLVLLALDQFPSLAETLGPDGCDLLLQAAAERLKKCRRAVDTVARLEGDEFTCLLEGINSRSDMDIVAKRVLDSIAQPFQVKEESVMVAVRIGVAVCPIDGRQADELIQRTQGALNAVRKAGRGNYQFPVSGSGNA